MATRQEDYRELVEHLPDAIVVHDGVTILFVNAEGAHLVGAKAVDDVVGKPVFSFVAAPFVAMVKDRIARVQRHQVVMPLVLERFVRLDGSEVDVEVKSMPITFNGQLAIQLVARDCSDRLRAERALLASETQFRRLVSDMPVGVLLQGPGAEILLCNPRALVLLGVSEDQLLGRTSFDRDWNVIHEDGSPFPGPEHPVPQALRTGQPVRNVVLGVFRPVSEDWVWLSVDAVPQCDPQGTVTQVVCTFVDVTERKAAEDRVQKLLSEKDLILREVHHRIKNNMSTIKGLLFLQAESLTEPGAYAALKDAESRIQSMMVLYDKLYRSTTFGRLSVRQYLPSLVDEVVANGRNAVAVRVVQEVGEFDLDVEQLQPLGIIVNELLTNALKYAFPGRESGEVRFRAHKTGAQVTIAVGDDGVGIPPEVDFEQSPGFGLSLVSLLADSLKGTLRIDRDHGTTVTLEFDDPSSP